MARRRYWNLYADCDAFISRVPALDFADQDPHSQRLFLASDYKNFDISDDDVRCSSRAYFANISYLNTKIGELMTALAAIRMNENTIILFCSDHGDMLGERGLWFKMSFFEGSARVPLIIQTPGQSPCTVATPVSTIDVTPTLAVLAGIDLDEIQPWTHGKSLLPLTDNAASAAPVLMEYAADGSIAPLVAVLDGDFKFIYCLVEPPQLFDLASDPDEMQNLANDPVYTDKMAHFIDFMKTRWDLEKFDADVRELQARRRIVYAALRQGHYFPWDYQPLQLAYERYMRNHLDLNILEQTKRFPRGE